MGYIVHFPGGYAEGDTPERAEAAAAAMQREPKRPENPCTRCRGLGAVVIAVHHVGDGCYNDDFDTCPRCWGSGEEPS